MKTFILITVILIAAMIAIFGMIHVLNWLVDKKKYVGFCIMALVLGFCILASFTMSLMGAAVIVGG